MDSGFRWLCILLFGLCICSIADIWSGTHYGVAAIGSTGNGPGKPQNCSAVALSSTSVQLTWNAPLGNGKLVKGYWIHYRPLYSKDKFLKFPVGSQFDHVVEGLDVITYYAFRIVVKDFAGNHDYCEVLAKTWRDASLAVPIRVSRGNETALIATWRAVNLQNVLVKYRLFMEWESKGVIHVRLLYEGPQTRCVVSGERLSFPYRMYVSVIVGRVFNFTVQAAYKPKYQTLKTALIPETTINDEPTNVFIDAYGWNFVNISWNALKTGNSHVIFTVTYKTGSTVKTEVTSKSTALLSGLEQLTSYRIKVKAVIDGGNLEISSTEVLLTTLDRNECAEIPDTCSNRSECVNTKGSYFCRCPLGWTGDGKACKELPDENANLAACDGHVYVNITWQRTLQGQTTLAQCPLGTRGVAKRECLEVSGGLPRWGVPDLSDCISDRIANIAEQLEDPNADVSEVAEQLANATELDPQAQTPLQTGDLKVVIDVIEKISQKGLGDVPNELPSIRDEKIRNIAQAVVKSSSNILDSSALETWKFMPKDSRASEASKLLKSVDTIALYLAKTGNQTEGVVSEAPNVVLSAIATDDAVPTDQRMPATAKSMRNVSSSSVVLPGSVLMLQRNKYNQSDVQYITFVSYRNLNALMQPNEDKTSSASKGENDEDRIESEVVSVSISPMEVNIFQEPVTLILRNSQQDEHEGEASCVYWNMSSVRGVWDETGCQLKEQNSSHTVCQCYHLTSFAVLMRVRDIPESAAMEKHKFALSLLSYIGLSVSVVALCICFLTFSCLRFRNMRHRYFVHANLALSLGLADTLFLFGINKTGNEVICKTIAITLHYLFLASFCWMALEGVILYLMLVKIFHTKSKPGRDKAFFFLGGWGVPAVVVAVCAGLFHEGYGTESFCWLTLENNFTWAFVAPVVLVCLFNGICLGKTFLVMSNSRKETQSDTRIQKIRYWSRGCALLSCLLGLTWILGVFVVNEDTIFMAYLFNIFNSLQGLLIFLFHCIGDEKVRAEYLRIIRCQARTKAYETARPWWSKSDSISRSRAWEDKNERHRRSTLSTNNSSKTTTDRPVSGRPNSANVQGNALLQGSLDRPLEMRLLYGTTEDDHMQDKEKEQAEIQREEEDESGTVEENQPIILEPNPDEEPNASVQNDETNDEDSSQPNLPDEVRNKDSDDVSVV